MFKRTPFILTVALCVAGVAGQPGSARAKKFAGEFMAVGGGARALGMGSAFAAVANDASALYWNPAGISGSEKRQALFMHSERFGDLVNYNFAAFTSPTALVAADREAAFGFALIHLGVDDIIIATDRTLEGRYIDVNNDGRFTPEVDRLLDTSGLPQESNNDFALLSTFAFKSDYGRIGGSLKLIYTDAIDGFSATGIGLDLGFLHRNLFVRSLDVGVKLQDITGTYISWSTGTNEFIAPSVKLGGAYRIEAPSLNAALLIAADSDVFFEDRRDASQVWADRYSADFHLGGEIIFQEKVMVRGGYDMGNPTAGAGFRFGFLGFDYAYLHHDDFDSTHRVSGLVEF